MEWHPVTEAPDPGRRVVALFNDASGAQLFWVHDHGLMDNDGQEGDKLCEKSFALWAYLPDDYRIWIEDNLD